MAQDRERFDPYRQRLIRRGTAYDRVLYVCVCVCVCVCVYVQRGAHCVSIPCECCCTLRGLDTLATVRSLHSPLTRTLSCCHSGTLFSVITARFLRGRGGGGAGEKLHKAVRGNTDGRIVLPVLTRVKRGPARASPRRRRRRRRRLRRWRPGAWQPPFVFALVDAHSPSRRSARRLHV